MCIVGTCGGIKNHIARTPPAANLKNLKYAGENTTSLLVVSK